MNKISNIIYRLGIVVRVIVMISKGAKITEKKEITWTNKEPSQEGWYWWRGLLPDRASSGTIVYLKEDSQYRYVMQFFYPLSRSYGIGTGQKEAWCGPLEPPNDLNIFETL
jgi:hypothetical protein